MWRRFGRQTRGGFHSTGGLVDFEVGLVAARATGGMVDLAAGLVDFAPRAIAADLVDFATVQL